MRSLRFWGAAAALTVATGLGVAAAAAVGPQGQQATPQDRSDRTRERADQVRQQADQTRQDAERGRRDADRAREEADGARARTRVLQVLRGRGSQIGVSVRDLETSDANGGRTGAVIAEVHENTPAARAGLKQGDVVMNFDGERVRSARQFARVVEESPAGRAVKATVQREGRSMDVEVTPEEGGGPAAWPMGEGRRRVGPGGTIDVPGFRMEMPNVPELADLPDIQNRIDMAFAPSGRLGVSVQELTPDLASYFGVKDGVLVSAVTPDSPAAKAGVKAGDVITSVDGTTINDAGDLRRLLWRRDQQGDATISLVRDKHEMQVKVSLPTRSDERRTQRTPA